MKQTIAVRTKAKPVKIEGMFVTPSMANIFTEMQTAETIKDTLDKSKRLRGIIYATSVPGVPVG